MSIALADFFSGKVPAWVVFILMLISGIKWWSDFKKLSILDDKRREAAKELEEYKLETQKELEGLRSGITKDQLIHKTQFEEEFKIYRELWSALAALADFTYALRPKYGTIDADKPPSQIKSERLREFAKAYEVFRISINKNRPFYAPEVHEAVTAVRDLCSDEGTAYQYLDPSHDRRDYWKNAEENREELKRLIEKANETIRRRFWSVTVQD